MFPACVTVGRILFFWTEDWSYQLRVLKQVVVTEIWFPFGSDVWFKDKERVFVPASVLGLGLHSDTVCEVKETGVCVCGFFYEVLVCA